MGHWRAGQGRGASLLAPCLSFLPLLRSITSSLATGALQGDRPGVFSPQLIVCCWVWQSQSIQAWPMHTTSSSLREWNILNAGMYKAFCLNVDMHACTLHVYISLSRSHTHTKTTHKMVSLKTDKTSCGIPNTREDKVRCWFIIAGMLSLLIAVWWIVCNTIYHAARWMLHICAC